MIGAGCTSQFGEYIIKVEHVPLTGFADTRDVGRHLGFQVQRAWRGTERSYVSLTPAVPGLRWVLMRWTNRDRNWRAGPILLIISFAPAIFG